MQKQRNKQNFQIHLSKSTEYWGGRARDRKKGEEREREQRTLSISERKDVLSSKEYSKR